jgi:prolyl-tRNA synthetase
VLVRRVTFGDEARKDFLPEGQAVAEMPRRLDDFQAGLLQRAKDRREANSYRGVNDFAQLKEIMDGPGGFVYTGWSGDPAVEERIKVETKATARVIVDPEFRSAQAPTRCIGGGEAKMEVAWAKAY